MTMPNEQELSYAKDFWGLANVTVGFSVVQTVAFLIAFASAQDDLAKQVACNAPLASGLALGATAVYVSFVAYCQRVHRLVLQSYAGMPLLSGHLETFNAIRLFAVTIIGGASVIFVFAAKMPHSCT